jgi:two-component system CheB/CheR fusion protein
MATITNLRPVPNGKRRVLVVEDNLDSVHSMTALIRMMGHEVQFAINGFAALDVARKYRPDIVILDLGLPDFRGEHLATQLKYEPGLEQTRIIAISGLPQANLEQCAREAGCAEFYRKPIDPTQLEEILAEPVNSFSTANESKDSAETGHRRGE